MNQDAIRSGWLILGRSAKPAGRTTPRFGRHQVGEKGLGRLAALRLGRTATLVTRPINELNTEYRVQLDWTKFESATTVESVELTIHKSRTTDTHGTGVEVSELRMQITRADVQRLGPSLSLLADPFDSENSFCPRL